LKTNTLFIYIEIIKLKMHIVINKTKSGTFPSE